MEIRNDDVEGIIGEVIDADGFLDNFCKRCRKKLSKHGYKFHGRNIDRLSRRVLVGFENNDDIVIGKAMAYNRIMKKVFGDDYGVEF